MASTPAALAGNRFAGVGMRGVYRTKEANAKLLRKYEKRLSRQLWDRNVVGAYTYNHNIDILQEMIIEQVHPVHRHYFLAMCIAFHKGEYQSGRDVWLVMERQQTVPDHQCLGKMLQICAFARRLDWALEIWNRYAPDLTWLTLDEVDPKPPPGPAPLTRDEFYNMNKWQKVIMNDGNSDLVRVNRWNTTREVYLHMAFCLSFCGQVEASEQLLTVLDQKLISTPTPATRPPFRPTNWNSHPVPPSSEEVKQDWLTRCPSAMLAKLNADIAQGKADAVSDAELNARYAPATDPKLPLAGYLASTKPGRQRRWFSTTALGSIRTASTGLSNSSSFRSQRRFLNVVTTRKNPHPRKIISLERLNVPNRQVERKRSRIHNMNPWRTHNYLLGPTYVSDVMNANRHDMRLNSNLQFLAIVYRQMITSCDADVERAERYLARFLALLNGDVHPAARAEPRFSDGSEFMDAYREPSIIEDSSTYSLPKTKEELDKFHPMDKGLVYRQRQLPKRPKLMADRLRHLVPSLPLLLKDIKLRRKNKKDWHTQHKRHPIMMRLRQYKFAHRMLRLEFGQQKRNIWPRLWELREEAVKLLPAGSKGKPLARSQGLSKWINAIKKDKEMHLGPIDKLRIHAAWQRKQGLKPDPVPTGREWVDNKPNATPSVYVRQVYGALLRSYMMAGMAGEELEAKMHSIIEQANGAFSPDVNMYTMILMTYAEALAGQSRPRSLDFPAPVVSETDSESPWRSALRLSKEILALQRVPLQTHEVILKILVLDNARKASRGLVSAMCYWEDHILDKFKMTSETAYWLCAELQTLNDPVKERALTMKVLAIMSIYHTRRDEKLKVLLDGRFEVTGIRGRSVKELMVTHLRSIAEEKHAKDSGYGNIVRDVTRSTIRKLGKEDNRF